MSIASRIDPSSVPQEIWSLVFSYLPLEDRKNVRLACHYFYKACCTYQIQKNEEMVFYGNLNTHSAIQSLCDTERKIWNIKLCKVHLEDDSVLPFFEKCGAHIRSLTLVNCVLKSGILRDILGPCQNLVCFSCIFTDYTDCCLSEAIFPEFEVLQKRGTFYTEVIDLTLKLRSYKRNWFTNKKLLQFFAIFPNVKNLRLTFFVDDIESSLLSSDVSSDNVFSVSCIYHQLLRIRHQLEELSIHIWCFHRVTYTIFETWSKIATIEMKNLKKLTSTCKIARTIEPPFSHFQHLTSLYWFISDTTIMPGCANLALILNSVSKLESLVVTVEYYEYAELCEKCIVALIRSRLKTFSLRTSLDLPSRSRLPLAVSSGSITLSSLDHLMPNYNLRHLGVLTNNSILLLAFSKYFPCLENMFVANAREDILYNIFNYQTKLRSLELGHCERYPVSRMRPTDNPFENRLRNLEIPPLSQLVNLTHLRIVDNISLDLSRFMLSNFAFSKLKSLTILMEDVYQKMNCDIDALWQMIHKSTRLEYLEISWRTVATFQQWLNLFESLPKLRHFSCTDSCLTFFDDSEYRQLFHSRSSLRSVYHYSKKSSSFVRYVNDIIRNTVIMDLQNEICSNPFPAR